MPAPILIVSGCSAVGKSTVSRLVADSLDSSVHVPTDVIFRFFDDPYPDPATPDGNRHYEVVGAALAAAAVQLAIGGYTVILDGPMFPDGVAGMAEMCGRHEVLVHYAVLRASSATCLQRAASRDSVGPPDHDAFRALHARFSDLGEWEANAIDASGNAQQVAASVLSAFGAGRLRPKGYLSKTRREQRRRYLQAMSQQRRTKAAGS